jgi:uncharacterized RDD family membrane protein YckC
VNGIRVIISLLIVAIAAVALVPMLVLIDLVSGGDGWGLCPEGLASCSTSYFDGPELAAGLSILVFVLLLLLRMALHAQRVAATRAQARGERSVGRGDRLGGG